MVHQPRPDRQGTKFGLTCTALLLLLASPRIAAAQAAVAAGGLRSGTMSFDGRAAVAEYSGTTSTMNGELRGGPNLESMRGWVETPVASLHTGKANRDAELNRAMESGRFETIRYELLGVTPGYWSADTANVILHGQFIMHGIVREEDLPARVVVGADGVMVRARARLDLQDYDIEGLGRMEGLLTTREDVVVHLDLTFGREQASLSAGRELTGGANVY